MSRTPAQDKAIKKWELKYERLYIRVPKGMKEKIEGHAKEKNTSINDLVNKLIEDELKSK